MRIRLLPALFSTARTAKLQDDLHRLRLLHVMFGFLLNFTEPKRSGIAAHIFQAQIF